MRAVPLTQGRVALVDDQDYSTISRYKWRFDRYAVRTAGRKTIYMHRIITDAPSGLCVDHANRNRLDNRRANLRVCTMLENHQNTVAKKGRYKGVSWDKSRNKWKATLCVNYRKINIGRYDTEREAAEAYNKAALYHQTNPRLNRL